MHVAVFLNTVKAPEQAKKFWGKREDRAELKKLVKTSVEVDKELERVAKKSSEPPNQIGRGRTDIPNSKTLTFH